VYRAVGVHVLVAVGVLVSLVIWMHALVAVGMYLLLVLWMHMLVVGVLVPLVLWMHVIVRVLVVVGMHVVIAAVGVHMIVTFASCVAVLAALLSCRVVPALILFFARGLASIVLWVFMLSIFSFTRSYASIVLWVFTLSITIMRVISLCLVDIRVILAAALRDTFHSVGRAGAFRVATLGFCFHGALDGWE
jgi:hypothetical protein